MASQDLLSIFLFRRWRKDVFRTHQENRYIFFQTYRSKICSIRNSQLKKSRAENRSEATFQRKPFEKIFSFVPPGPLMTLDANPWQSKHNSNPTLRSVLQGTSVSKLKPRGKSGVHHKLQTRFPVCHGDVVRTRIGRTYSSREGDMSWWIMTYYMYSVNIQFPSQTMYIDSWYKRYITIQCVGDWG